VGAGGARTGEKAGDGQVGSWSVGSVGNAVKLTEWLLSCARSWMEMQQADVRLTPN
jgi:hypothetical protein